MNADAFETEVEANLVNLLRESGTSYISLVAEQNERIVGHILFTPVTLEGDNSGTRLAGLGPMAVAPNLQKQGIGSMLVKEGLRRIKETDCPFIIVLGHEHYYPRFGFEQASKYGLKSQWEGVPDEAFMVMILNKSVMADVSGVASYRDEFDEAM